MSRPEENLGCRCPDGCQLIARIRALEAERDATATDLYDRLTDKVRQAEQYRGDLIGTRKALADMSARTLKAEAGKRDPWIAGRNAALAELDELSTAPFGHDNEQVRDAWHGGFDEALKDAKHAVGALQPPKRADG